MPSPSPLSTPPLNSSLIFFSPSYLAFILCYGPTLSPLHSSFHLSILLYFFHPLTSSFSYCIHCPPSPNLSSHHSISPSLLSCLPSPIFSVVNLNLFPSCTCTFGNYSVHPPFCSSKLCFTPSCLLTSLLSICFPLFSFSRLF